MNHPRPMPIVRLIVRDAKGRVLLLRRANTDFGDGAWNLPGGKVDHGQTVAEAAAIELSEETTLQSLNTRFLFYQDSLPSAASSLHCINLYFECEVAGTVTLNDESSEYTWVTRHELGAYDVVFGNDAGLQRYWREFATDTNAP